MKKFFFLCLLFIKSLPGWAADLLPVSVYGSLPEVSMVVVSPSGNSIAYRRTEGDRDMVITYSLKDKKMTGGIDVSQIRPSHIYFVNEDTLLLVAVENTKLFGYRGRHDISAGFSYRISENKVGQLLVPGNGIYEGQTGLGRVVGVSNDGRFVYMPAWKTGGEYALMKVNLAGKRTPKSVKRGKYDADDYFIYNDTILARELYDHDKNRHRVQSLIDNEWKTIYEEIVELRTRQFVGLTSDLKSLVFSAYGSNDRVAYYTMALADGKVSGPVFNPDDKDIESVIRDVNQVIHGVRYSGFKPSYDFFNKSLDESVKAVLSELSDYSVTLMDYTSDFQSLVFSVEGVDTPGDYFLYQNGGFKHIATSRSNVSAEHIFQVVETEIKARDGLKIPTLLTLPAVDELANLPAIMLPHGGPESYDKLGFDWLAQYFASRGYIVMQPQFRGSDGFGWEFKRKGHGEWGKKMQDDLTDTVKTMVKSGYVDPQRVCIVGGSYGGYAALAGAAFTPDVYKCAIAYNGVFDIERMMSDVRKGTRSSHSVITYWESVISEGDVNDDHIEQISPINHVKDIKIPVLLIHGTRDEVVPYRQSENLYDEMKDAGKSVKYIELKKGDHYLSKAEHRIKALQAIDVFIKKHL